MPAKNKNPQNPQLWLAAVRAEMRHGNNKEVDILMAMALDKCPKSGNVITIPTSMGLWPSYSAIIVRL
ncbi:protein STABILIZED1-like [Prunus yedoensis var. nudiflora]|uniref:Protein STABILIZED1-like n=1 Tax=Prunus yedoensis var. nudiflora TaxID=2094558 RepID=A0A314Y977_PRUYE|nr:protein STABILIZED1-like [Prunus yedoensis var. nudiflora]